MLASTAQPIPIASGSSSHAHTDIAGQSQWSPRSLAMSGSSLEQRFSLGLSPGSFGADGASLKAKSAFDGVLLQEEMCRNYTCCGLALLDLHQLVDHFEEAHVVVVDERGESFFSAGGFELPDDMELDHHVMPASAPSAFDTTSVLVRRSSAPSTTAYAPYPPRAEILAKLAQRRMSDLPCASPTVLFSPSATPSREPSPDFDPALSSTVSVTESAPVPHDGEPRRKPFRCPKEGCNKSYKQANGLKYHITHGQCNFAPVDPNSDDVKPYECQAGCGKRFKNMSGLRYHYQHTGDHGKIGLSLLPPGQAQSASVSASS
ncbi:hypothetical protein EXIGLDRAFT_734034 [Exidia glandulosa HHB12029]|uniref:C2H2-type domain-containing protein n=1 Tax=Exidia glandulosa HHB12029 TaxID=1314781 RepID=A0A165B5I3_EXIGL|nr:hypothetical protein EXIGLDRAFT_734034 [Exidia glandulosa HHB12029]